MGNCQAAEAATVVIQHPDERLERAYVSLPASRVMVANPGHYVALIVTSASPRPRSTAGNASTSDLRSCGGRGDRKPARYLKLLRPDDTLLIGHVYRLVSFEEVLREFASKRHVKLSRLLAKQEKAARSRNGSGNAAPDGAQRDVGGGGPAPEPENSPAVVSQEEHEAEARQDTELEQVVQGMMSSPGTTSAGARHGQWRPALQSIAEVGAWN